MLPSEVTNTSYVIRILSKIGGREVLVRGHTPDELKLSFGAQFGNAYPSFITQGQNTLAALGGIKLFQNQFFTSKVYQGSETPTIDFNLIFDAEQDAYRDVMVPALKLVNMTLPEDRGGMIVVPGPSYFDQIKQAFQNKPESEYERITLTYGRILRVSPVCISRLHFSIPSRFDKNGYPIRIAVGVSIVPFYNPMKNNFEYMDNGAVVRTESKGANEMPLDFQFGPIKNVF